MGDSSPTPEEIAASRNICRDIAINAEDYAALIAISDDLGMSVSEIIARAIAEFIHKSVWYNSKGEAIIGTGPDTGGHSK